MPELIQFATMSATDKLTLKVVGGKVTVTPGGEGGEIVLSSTKPENYKVTDKNKSGIIKEVGGNAGEAVEQAEAKGAGSSFISSGMINGKCVINGVVIPEPDPVEELLIVLPATMVGMLKIESRFFAHVTVEAGFAGILDGSASMKAGLVVAEQLKLIEAELAASASAKLQCGDLKAKKSFSAAASSGAEVVLGRVDSATSVLNASSGGTIDGKKIKCTGPVEATVSGARINLEGLNGEHSSVSASAGGKFAAKAIVGRSSVDLSGSSSGTVRSDYAVAPELDLSASSGGGVTLEDADAQSVSGQASSGGAVKVRKGSADHTSGQASSGGQVRFSGDFNGVSKSQSSGGSVSVERQVGDAPDRFMRAVKRGFDAFGTNPFAGAVGGLLAAMLAQSQGEMKPEDEPVVSAICGGIGKALKESDMQAVLLKSAELLSTKVGGDVEALTDNARIQQALSDAELVKDLQATFVLFTQVLQRVLA